VRRISLDASLILKRPFNGTTFVPFGIIGIYAYAFCARKYRRPCTQQISAEVPLPTVLAHTGALALSAVAPLVMTVRGLRKSHAIDEIVDLIFKLYNCFLLVYFN
jgi:hypothetical protein